MNHRQIAAETHMEMFAEIFRHKRKGALRPRFNGLPRPDQYARERLFQILLNSATRRHILLATVH